MAQVLVYTSAKKLLAAGRSGFGTVARSRKISALATGTIERLSQFDSQRGSNSSRVILAHRRLNVGNASIHLLSAIRDAGSDYTGRTNHIAHHLLVDAAEARRLASQGITPADVLQNYTWLESWDGAPQYFEDNEDVNLLTLPMQRVQGSREHWQSLTGNGAHARLLASKEAPKSAVLVFPDPTRALSLMAEALGELKERAWDVSFTTALEPSDNVGDFAWILTTTSDMEAVKGRCVSRPVIRADQADQLPVPEDTPAVSSAPSHAGALQQTGPSAATIPLVGNRGVPGLAAPIKPQVQIKREVPSDLKQSPGHKGPRAQASKDSSSKRQTPILAIVGASVALIIAMVILLNVVRKGDGANSFDAEGASVTISESTMEDLSVEEREFTSEFMDMGLDRDDAVEIAQCVGESNFEVLKNYLDELKEVCASETPWKQLTQSQHLGKGLEDVVEGKSSKNAPQWLKDLMQSSNKKKVFRDLHDIARAASKADAGLTIEQWRSFEEVATSRAYAKGFPFEPKPDGWGNPFPKMAKELLLITIGATVKANADKGKAAEDESQEVLTAVHGLEIWEKKGYKKIPEQSYKEAMLNAEEQEIEQSLVMYENYKGVTGDAEKKKLREQLSEWLVADHDSKPEHLLTHLKGGAPRLNAAESGQKKSAELEADTEEGEGDKAQVTRYYIVSVKDLKKGTFKTELLGRSNKGDLKYIIDNESYGYVDGGLLNLAKMKETGIKIGEGGSIELGNNSKIFSEMIIKDKGETETEHICVYGDGGAKSEEPLWGAHKFESKLEGEDLVLTGELIDHLNQLVDPKQIKFKFKKMGGDRWVMQNYNKITRREALKFKGNPAVREQLKSLREKCETEYKKPLTGNSKEKREIQLSQSKSSDDLYKHMQAILPKDKIKGQYENYFKAEKKSISLDGLDDMRRPENCRVLVGFAKYLYEQSDAVEIKKKNDASINKQKNNLKTMRELKVYALDKKCLLFIGTGAFIEK